jgi:A/G-specific adenine glycosylase
MVASPNSVMHVNRQDVARVRRALLGWYEVFGREFFWRRERLSPFAMLVVEMLLSRTRAQAVEPVAAELLRRFPTADAVCKAGVRRIETVLYPLGLHRKRAQLLVRCADVLVRDWGGVVPLTQEELLKLPYVGRYAASALRCFLLGARVPVVDANVARVYRRALGVPIPERELRRSHASWDFARRFVPRVKAREFNWALLDLGGTVCTPRAPRCASCPLAQRCVARSSETRKRLRGLPILTETT